MERSVSSTWAVRLAAALYLTATSLGLWLRAGQVWPVLPINPAFATHAHSHTLYFGWAALTLFALMFEQVGASGRVANLALALIGLVSAATFAAFLTAGYGPPGFAVSSLSLPIFGLAIAVLFRHARGDQSPEAGFWRAAAAYVGLAGLGAGTRAVMAVTQQGTGLGGRLAVFAFLHCFAAFFSLAATGLLARHARTRGYPLSDRLLRRQLWVHGLFSMLTFPMGVAGGLDGALGWVARGAALALLVGDAALVQNLWETGARAPGPARLALRTLAATWAAKAAMQLLGALGLAEAAAALRHPAILFLHVVLLGFVSGALLFLLEERDGGARAPVLGLHQAGVAVMSLGLLGPVAVGLVGAPAELYRLGLIGAFLGGAMVIAAGVAWAVRRASA